MALVHEKPRKLIATLVALRHFFSGALLKDKCQNYIENCHSCCMFIKLFMLSISISLSASYCASTMRIQLSSVVCTLRQHLRTLCGVQSSLAWRYLDYSPDCK